MSVDLLPVKELSSLVELPPPLSAAQSNSSYPSVEVTASCPASTSPEWPTAWRLARAQSWSVEDMTSGGPVSGSQAEFPIVPFSLFSTLIVKK